MTSEFGMASLSKECLEHLNLDQNPFTEHAGDTYIYSDRQTEMTTNVILDNLQNSNSSIVICGDQGIGKTTYLRKLLRKGYQRYQFCTLRAKTNMSFQDICDKIAQRWIIHTSDNSSTPVSRESIEDYVVVYLGEQNHGVIIIDDADRLSLEVINELLTLKHRVGLAVPGRLGLVVTGKNSLILSLSELEGMNPAASQVYQVNIRPFNKEQTVNYVQFRLRTAGSSDTLPLDEDEIEGIHDASRGIAREVHRLAMSALRNKCSELGTNVFTDAETEHAVETSSHLKPILLFGLPVLIAAVIFWVMNNDHDAVQDKIPLTLPEQIVEQERLDTPASHQDTIGPLIMAEPDDTDTPSAVIEKPHAADDAAAAGSEPEESSTETSGSFEPVEIERNEVETVQPIPVEESQSAEETSTDQNKSSNEPNRLSDLSIPDEKATYGVDWLKQVDSQHYSLQILASANPQRLSDLVKKHNIDKHYAIYQKTVNGKKWYVLVAGDYSSRQAASAAIKDLPAELQKAKPWPVSISSILNQL